MDELRDLDIKFWISVGVKVVWSVVWVYGISIFLGYLMPNPFLYK